MSLRESDQTPHRCTGMKVATNNCCRAEENNALTREWEQVDDDAEG